MVTLSHHHRLGVHSAAPSESAHPAEASTLEHFLTPEAMLTPGIAGTITMSIANTLYSSLGAPAAWTALILSFVFGTLVLAESRKLRVRAVLYVLNSLVIFCMAWGMNSVGAARTERGGMAGFEAGLIGPAHAQAPGQADTEAIARACSEASARVAEMQRSGATPQQIDETLAPCRDLTQSVQPGSRTRSLQPHAQSDQPQGFFRPWKF